MSKKKPCRLRQGLLNGCLILHEQISVLGAACQEAEVKKTQRGFEIRTVPLLILIVTGVLILQEKVW
jgi:hypothetical protein